MKRMSIKGVLTGGIVDVMATNILVLPLIAVVAQRIDAAQFPADQMGKMIELAIQSHPALFAIQAVIGVACSVLGGYTAAWLAKHDHLLNGALSSWLCIGFGLYGLATGSTATATTVQIVGLMVSPVAGLLGGYLRLRQTARRLARA